ncbi:MAG: TetR/AcrR family transcriptional regulator, ethionamide resistance regulator [Solirubrobacteraceae bacterium]|nr:TetR/AcrR family transcriptional regulator, ethionamide resistance regulator [Solirubrobacteraceae bacterium]
MTDAIEALLDAGESFTEISVERLAAAGGLSRSTFYVYFEDKSDLLETLTEHVIDGVLESGKGWWELPPTLARADVERALRAVLEHYRPHLLLMRARLEAHAYDEASAARFKATMATATQGIAAHITAGQATGHIRPEIDPEPTGAWFGCMVERGLFLLNHTDTEIDVDRLSKSVADIIWNTLYAGAPAR